MSSGEHGSYYDREPYVSKYFAIERLKESRLAENRTPTSWDKKQICPFCGRVFNDKMKGAIHIKSCGKGLPTETIMAAVDLQDKQIEEWNKIGLRSPAILAFSRAKRQRKKHPITRSRLVKRQRRRVNLNKSKIQTIFQGHPIVSPQIEMEEENAEEKVGVNETTTTIGEEVEDKATASKQQSVKNTTQQDVEEVSEEKWLTVRGEHVQQQETQTEMKPRQISMTVMTNCETCNPVVKDILSMLTESTSTDIIIFGKEGHIIHSHIFMLQCRIPSILRDAIVKLTGSKLQTFIPLIKYRHEVVSALIHYVYTGYIKQLNHDALQELDELRASYGIIMNLPTTTSTDPCEGLLDDLPDAFFEPFTESGDKPNYSNGSPAKRAKNV